VKMEPIGLEVIKGEEDVDEAVQEAANDDSG
jgi:hypothetical protein